MKNKTIADGLRTVFSNTPYMFLALFLSLAISLVLMVSMNVLQIYPIYFVDTYNLFSEGILNILTGLLFLFLVPVLSSLTISMITYKMMRLKCPVGKESPVAAFGIFSGLFTSSCSTCIPFFLMTAGITYGTFSALVAPLIIPIRIVSIVVLVLSFYLTAESVNKICKIRR